MSRKRLFAKRKNPQSINSEISERERIAEKQSKAAKLVALIQSGGIIIVAIVGFIGVLVGVLGTILTPKIQNYFIQTSKNSDYSTQLNSTTDKNEKKVIMAGSGTVVDYLGEIGLKTQLDKQVHFLQGQSETGSRLFAYAVNDYENILVMSSTEQTIGNLSLSEIKPESVFEVRLGTDDLQLLLIAPNQDSLNTAFKSILNSTQSCLINKITSTNEPHKLEFEDLIKNEKWAEPDSSIRIGKDGSGTNTEWSKHIVKYGKWNSNFQILEIQDFDIDTKIDKPVMFLGSKILNKELIDKNPTLCFKPINMFDKSSQATRGLYLYGKVRKEEKQFGSNKKFYTISPEISDVLKYILHNNPNNCAKTQLDYFNLNDDNVGRVEPLKKDERIYNKYVCD